jgi:hypothetical protein
MSLVVIQPRVIRQRQFQHGETLPPGFVSEEEANQLQDIGWLREFPERRSLYEIFEPFVPKKEKP